MEVGVCYGAVRQNFGSQSKMLASSEISGTLVKLLDIRPGLDLIIIDELGYLELT
jgi:hypothetical protein